LLKWKRNNEFSVLSTEQQVTVNYVKILRLHNSVLWKICIAGKNNTYVAVHVKRPML